MIQLSICIVNWNTEDLLRQCINSIYESTEGITYEIIVVDNASDDRSVPLVKTVFPEVALIENETNVGFAKANNQAVRISKGKYVLFLNSDTVVLPSALKMLVDFMEDHPKAGACGPKLLNPDKTRQPSAKSFPSFYTELINQLRFNFPPVSQFLADTPKTTDKYLNRDGIIDVDIINGACLMVRKKVLEKVGLMEEDFFLFSEETDLCLRIRKDGWMIYYVPEPEVIHLVGESRKKLYLRLPDSSFFESKVKYYRKHKGSWHALTIKFLYITFTLWRIAWNVTLLFIKMVGRKDFKKNTEDISHSFLTLKKLYGM